MYHGKSGNRKVAKGKKQYSSNIEMNRKEEMEQAECNKYIIGRG